MGVGTCLKVCVCVCWYVCEGVCVCEYFSDSLKVDMSFVNETFPLRVNYVEYIMRGATSSIKGILAKQ